MASFLFSLEKFNFTFNDSFYQFIVYTYDMFLDRGYSTYKAFFAANVPLIY